MAACFSLEAPGCGFPEYGFPPASGGTSAGTSSGESGAAGSDGGDGGHAGEAGSAAGGSSGMRTEGCNDGVWNGSETDLDCGGGCARKCNPDELCQDGPRDCKSLLCNDDGRCTETSCEDDTQNGDESDVDCGGAGECDRCPPLAACSENEDCSSGSCTNELCDSGLRLYYYTQIKGDSALIRPEIRVENVGVEPVALSRIALRYYLSVAGEGTGAVQISENTADVSGATSRSVTASTVWQLESIEPLDEADSYLEITFASSAGSLAADESVTVLTSLSFQGGGTMQQGDDYSFDPGATQGSPYDRVPLYFDGDLLVGAEPE